MRVEASRLSAATFTPVRLTSSALAELVATLASPEEEARHSLGTSLYSTLKRQRPMISMMPSRRCRSGIAAATARRTMTVTHGGKFWRTWPGTHRASKFDLV
eukprot:5528257-Pyramimonas_sp.AAC.1